MLLYEELTWPELDALDRERTVVCIPFSPLEEHGPHLPIGTDLMVARHFAVSLAQTLEERRPDVTGLIVPAIPLGAGTIPLRGSVNVTVDLVFDIARQVGAAFARDGFQTIVFITGHLGAWHLIALENAALWLSRHYRVRAIAPTATLARQVIMQRGLADDLGVRIAIEELGDLLRATHAGMLETSIMLALRPDLVRPIFAQLPRLTRSAMVGWRGRTPAAWPGYVGKPAGATAEWGEAATQAFARLGADLVLTLLADRTRSTRSARIFPRLPFWLSWRRLGMSLAAAAVGATLTLAATRTLRRG